jgi:ketosteroid isomerase-like protein
MNHDSKAHHPLLPLHEGAVHIAAGSSIHSEREKVTNIDIAKSYIKAVQTNDQATLSNLLSLQVVWHQPGNNQFSGTKNGIAEFGAMVGGMMERSGGSFAITHAHRYLANGNLVAIEIEFSGQREGAKVDQPGIDLLRIVDGKIVEVWLFSSDPEQEDAFWG